MVAEVSGTLSTRVLGSEFDYQRVTLSASNYYSLIPDLTRLVFCTRGVYSMQFGDVPFFSMDTLAFNSYDRDGLGGYDSIRGFKRNRFIGKAAVLVNTELRWSITEWEFGSQNLRPQLAPFVDTGRVFDDVDMKFNHWKVGYGIGFRLVWNLSTVISFDFGCSREDKIFYMEIGHQF